LEVFSSFFLDDLLSGVFQAIRKELFGVSYWFVFVCSLIYLLVNERSWLYRIRPNVGHSKFVPLNRSIGADCNIANVEQLRFKQFALPTTPTDFVDGLHAIMGAGRRKIFFFSFLVPVCLLCFLFFFFFLCFKFECIRGSLHEIWCLHSHRDVQQKHGKSGVL
jgi:hypothetical protein